MSRPGRVIVFSCAGAPFSAEVLRTVNELDPGSLEGIVAVVLSRPPAGRRTGASSGRDADAGMLAELRLALAYRRRRLARTARRRARALLRALGLMPTGRWRYIEDFCDETGLPVHYTRDPSSRDTLDFLRAHEADLVLMMTFHHILRAELLAIPGEDVFNLHCSLLPEFRGPDPIGDAIRAEASRTGVSLHRVDTGIDTGEVVAQEQLDLGPDDRDPDRLRQRLARLGARLVVGLLRSTGPGAARGHQAAGDG